MYPFIQPDYYGTNIVNLMSSISHCFGKKHLYAEHAELSSVNLQLYENIILLVIDGLGYNYLTQQKNSFLLQHLHTRLTTTFLSTTACANTVFAVGYPPQQHALTGWDINLKEVGAVTTILPFTPMFGKELLTASGFEINQILDTESFHKNFQCESFVVIDKKIAHTPFAEFVSRDTEIVPASSQDDLFSIMGSIVKKGSGHKKFIRSYIPEFDGIAHSRGINSKEVSDFFCHLDKTIEKFVQTIQRTKSLLIVTSDHGLIDTEPSKELWIENFKNLKECMTIPLTGEGRVRYCYIRPRRVSEFEKIIDTYLEPYCWCFKSEQIIDDHFFGLGEPHPKLFERAGDYILIMKDRYVLYDKLSNFKTPSSFQFGKHGGISSDEMHVPLIYIPS